MNIIIGRYVRGEQSISRQTSAPQAAFISKYWALQLNVYAVNLPLFPYSEYLFIFANGKEITFEESITTKYGQ